MPDALDALGVERMSVSQRLELIARIWDTLPDTDLRDALPDWHRDEVQRRIERAEAIPEDVVPWKQARADLLSQG